MTSRIWNVNQLSWEGSKHRVQIVHITKLVPKQCG